VSLFGFPEKQKKASREKASNGARPANGHLDIIPNHSSAVSAPDRQQLNGEDAMNSTAYCVHGRKKSGIHKADS